MGRRVKQRLTQREQKALRDKEKEKLAPMPDNYVEIDMTDRVEQEDGFEREPEGQDLEPLGSREYERQKAEEANRALQKPISPGDSTETIVAKCRFQDDVRHKYTPTHQGFVRLRDLFRHRKRR